MLSLSILKTNLTTIQTTTMSLTMNFDDDEECNDNDKSDDVSYFFGICPGSDYKSDDEESGFLHSRPVETLHMPLFFPLPATLKCFL